MIKCPQETNKTKNRNDLTQDERGAVGFHSLEEVPDAVVVSAGGAVGALGQERERIAIARLCPIDKKKRKRDN